MNSQIATENKNRLENVKDYTSLESLAEESYNIGWGQEYLPTNGNLDEILNHSNIAINDQIDDNVKITDYKNENNENYDEDDSDNEDSD